MDLASRFRFTVRQPLQVIGEDAATRGYAHQNGHKGTSENGNTASHRTA